MKNTTMTPTDIYDILRSSNGEIFSVTFTKRTTGELRKMVARIGVKKYLKGGELGYNAKSRNLLPCFDMQKQAYRMIPVDAVHEIKIHGEEIIP